MYLGIDIGGTKTLVGSFNDDGTIADTVKFATPQDYQSFLEELKTRIDQLPAQDFTYCGIGIPGTIDRSKGVSTWTGGNLVWKSCPIAADVSAIAGCEVIVENDANLAGLSEASLVKDTYHTALYITISTGIGGGFIVDGVINKRTADAEIGHMIYRDGNSYRTWEQIASGKTIFEQYGQRAEDITDPATWKVLTEPIAVGLINISAVLTPGVIIIGGGVGASLHKFKGYLDNWLKELTPTAITVPPILEAQHPEKAVLYGCYELAKQRSSNAKAD